VEADSVGASLDSPILGGCLVSSPLCIHHRATCICGGWPGLLLLCGRINNLYQVDRLLYRPRFSLRGGAHATCCHLGN
jgi:hypothetical protein